MTTQAMTTQATVAPARRRRNAYKIGKGLLFISPWLIGFLAFSLYPIIMSAYYSLCRYAPAGTPVFIGLTNYIDLIGTDKLFVVSLLNTAYYVVFMVPLGNAVAITLAVLLNMKIRGQAIYRTIYYLPSIIPIVATSVVWIWLLNPQYGIVNGIMKNLHIPTIGWFSDPSWSKPSLILMSLWGVGGAAVIYLAALQDVPQELYEAASLDGANAVGSFLHVTLPLISPVILFNVVIGLIVAFQYFTQAYVISGGAGGPADSTLFYSLYLYNNAFRYFKMGYASSQAWILLVIVAAATWVTFRTSAERVYYSGR